MPTQESLVLEGVRAACDYPSERMEERLVTPVHTQVNTETEAIHSHPFLQSPPKNSASFSFMACSRATGSSGRRWSRQTSPASVNT